MTYPNWFEQIAQYNFEHFLLPEKGKPWLRYLQLGCFTGDASLWLLENVLTGPYSHLYDIDTWEGAHNEPVQEQMDFNDVYKTYQDKVGHFLNLSSIKTTTQNFLINYRLKAPAFDFVYVDAHHTAASAFMDSELSWPLLKQGGILAIDDYEWVHPDGSAIHSPKLGVRMFLDRHDKEYELLEKNQQLWIKKK